MAEPITLNDIHFLLGLAVVQCPETRAAIERVVAKLVPLLPADTYTARLAEYLAARAE